MTKLFIGDPLVISQKTEAERDRHEKKVFKRMDELLELCKTKTRKEANPEYPKNPAAPKFIWKDTPPKMAIMHIKRGYTTMEGTNISYNNIVTSEYPIKDEKGKVVKTIVQKGAPGKLCVEWIRW